MANIPRLVGAPDFGKLIAPEESLGKRLEGKRVLLTGTTKGVGRVTQELLCARAPSCVAPAAPRAWLLRWPTSWWPRATRLRASTWTFPTTRP